MSTQDFIDGAERFGPWINRVLLGVVAFFLIQTNSKFNEVIIKIDTALITQAAHEERIVKIEEKQDQIRLEIKDLERANAVSRENITDFYKEYSYLFTDKTRRKLE